MTEWLRTAGNEAFKNFFKIRFFFEDTNFACSDRPGMRQSGGALDQTQR